ncbi:MAG: 50S ribosomal protein L25 [Planctomycetales bacterium]|nr:50S ribosomal protein L25 [Planctomycetales bacterium]
MAKAEKLQVEKRAIRGTAKNRRMRASGKIPAILYGHGEESVALTLRADQLDAALRHGAHVVELAGDLNENALLKQLQWDALGSAVIHVDLTRVSAGESVEVTLAVDTRGVAPGVSQGGVVEHVTHEVTISCPVTKIPEKLVVSINDLNLNDTILVSDLELPSGATLVTHGEDIVVHCIEPVEAPEEEAAPAGAEPEVIGSKPESESDED